MTVLQFFHIIFFKTYIYFNFDIIIIMKLSNRFFFFFFLLCIIKKKKKKKLKCSNTKTLDQQSNRIKTFDGVVFMGSWMKNIF